MKWGIVVEYDDAGLECCHWLENNDGYGYKVWADTTFDTEAEAVEFIAQRCTDLSSDIPMIPPGDHICTARRKA